MPCPGAPAWKYESSNPTTGGGSLTDPRGNALTAQSCAGTGAGDHLIGGYKAVKNSCHQPPGKPTNQAVKMVPLPGGKGMEIQMEQDGMCAAVSAQGGMETAKCGTGAKPVAAQAWTWTSGKQLQSMTHTTTTRLCLGDGFGPAPAPAKPVGKGQVWARPLKVRQTPSWPRSWADFSLL